jgi:uncharacterized protein involved in type VI secretion and phage assembly
VSRGFTVPTILVGGQPLASTFAPAVIDVTRGVNRIPAALISIQAQKAVADAAAFMAGGPFKPADEVEIKFRQGDDADVSVFKGVVTALVIRTRDGLPVLEAIVKDKAVRLAGARNTRIWTDMADSDVIQSLVTDASLQMGDAPSTAIEHKTLVQNDSTDWDFILTRADAQGLAVVVKDGAVSLKTLAIEGSAARSFSLGLDSITDIHFEFDAATQTSAISGLAWDPEALAPASPADASVLPLPQGDVGSAPAGDGLGIGPTQLIHMAPLAAGEAKAWANSRMARARLALIRGRISVEGIPNAELMEVAELKGFGHRLDGKALVTGVRHRLDSHGFMTDLQFGLAPEPVARLPDIAGIPAGGLLPPISGLHLGTIAKSSAEDPEGLGKVQVMVSSVLTDPPQALWARVASPDAGGGRGFCFMPEAGDEVLVGFLSSDPRHPVVLGRLWGGKNMLPKGFGDAQTKGIVGKRDTRITFSESEMPSITISTPGGRTIILDDAAGTIVLADKNDNKLKLDAGGVTIDCAGNLTIRASGAVSIEGSAINLN